MKPHVMLDLEVLAVRRKDAAIVQLAAVAFNPMTGEIISTTDGYVRPDPSAGEYIDPNTVAWWLTQSKAADLGRALQTTADPLSIAIDRFDVWYRAVDPACVWSHGAAFDIAIVEHHCGVNGIDVPWHYRHPRDTRTLYDLTPGGMPKLPKDPAREHDALYDCEYQAAQVVEALRLIRERVGATWGDLPIFGGA